MKNVTLVPNNPHSFGDDTPVRDWWGKEIEVGYPHKPKRMMPCGSLRIWPIIGPQEFVEALAGCGREDSYICEHMTFDEEMRK